MHGGIEWLVDAHGCAAERLRDRAAVVGLLERIVADMQLHVVATSVHEFAPRHEPDAVELLDGVSAGGITALYLLAESHLAIHTFPETGLATLNAYCCTPRRAADWRALLGEWLGARDVVVRELPRGDR